MSGPAGEELASSKRRRGGKKTSAGLLMFRFRGDDGDEPRHSLPEAETEKNAHLLKRLQVFIVKPGGPLWASKNVAAWSIPKGEFAASEQSFRTALREFAEETGRTWRECTQSPSSLPLPYDEESLLGDVFLPLGSVIQRGGKRVTAWAFEGDWPDGQPVVSNHFEMRLGGRLQSYPEVDQGRFVDADEAEHLLNPAQAEFVQRLKHEIVQNW